MSVDSTFYVVYGVEVPYDSELVEEALEILDDPEKMAIVDYMCGEYMVLGKILARMNAHKGNFTTIDIDTLEEYAAEYVNKFDEIFGNEMSRKYLQDPFKIIVFEHLS